MTQNPLRGRSDYAPLRWSQTRKHLMSTWIRHEPTRVFSIEALDPLQLRIQIEIRPKCANRIHAASPMGTPNGKRLLHPVYFGPTPPAALIGRNRIDQNTIHVE